MAGASGKKLVQTYNLAWVRSTKTTSNLRTMGETHAEKSTTKAGALNAVSATGGLGGGVTASAAPGAATRGEDIAGPACMLRPGDPGFEECEACQ